MPIELVPAAAGLAAFAGLVLWAAAADIAEMLIPNRISVALAALFPLVALAAGLPPLQIGLHLAVGFVVFLIGFGLFSLGVLGGGDVKVIAAVSVWTGISALASFAMATTIAGGVLAAGMLLLRRAAAPRPAGPAFLNRLLEPKNGIPYAVAIAVGAFVSAPAQPLARALLGG